MSINQDQFRILPPFYAAIFELINLLYASSFRYRRNWILVRYRKYYTIHSLHY